MRIGKKSYLLATALVLIVVVVAGGAFLRQKILTYHADIWLPNYFAESHTNDLDRLDGGHVMFLISDHHEPGSDAAGTRIGAEWCDRYRDSLARVRDDYDNPFRYTWFYPYDHANSDVVLQLNELVYDGLGEIEFHWHHGRDDNLTFPAKLAGGVEWFTSHGCMLPIDGRLSPRFGFVHGNWALDNSTGKIKHCGVTRELDILADHGCYGDFTMANLSAAQPATINTLYYAIDTDDSKSYDTGVPAAVGRRGEGFLIFPGPICCDWRDLQFDCAGVESTSPPKPHRVKLWLKHAPAVDGRPDWIFLKVYTHGVPSQDMVLGEPFIEMIDELKSQCDRYGLSLHFVTAREAFNIMRAVEDGESGDPENYRDYEIAPPANSLVRLDRRVEFNSLSPADVAFRVLEPDSAGFSFSSGSVASVSGLIHGYRCLSSESGDMVSVYGDGVITVTARSPMNPVNPLMDIPRPDGFPATYRLKALPPADYSADPATP